MRKVEFKKGQSIEKCPDCGQNTVFLAHSQRIAEDCCEVWVDCICGYSHDAKWRLEDVWGGTRDSNVINAVGCWNTATRHNINSPQCVGMMERVMNVVLAPAQPEVTLDDALLDAMATFPNGCNFRLIVEADGRAYLTYGCYGVHVNLAQGKQRLLMEWYGVRNEEPKLLPIAPETLVKLLKREPCRECGGTRFKPRQH